MHRAQLLLFDLVLVAFATVCALVLRDNLEFSPVRFSALVPYLALTLLSAAVVFPLLGTSRTIWRFAAMPDYLRLLAATALIVLAAVAFSFGYNRLDGIARALPILQGLLILVVLVGTRVLMRLRHAARGKPSQLAVATSPLPGTETVLVVGLGRLTDLYLRSVAEFAPERVRIAGLLGRNPHQTGRFVHNKKVLGTPDQIGETLRDLEVHGVLIDRIVVTTAHSKLSETERLALLSVEKSSAIRVEFIAELMGLDAPSDAKARDGISPPHDDTAAFLIGEAELAALARRPYWLVKRASDVLGALVLLVLLAPVMLLAATLTAINVGVPVTFRQQRPGLGGRPFKLYKLRTMASAHDADGHPVPESMRLSIIGRFLRRTRLDELPQLVNILIGQMSFIGPRPLLSADQSAAYAARLLVRPGLTGWAQVKGGREVSAANKAALDVWYVKNASLALDLRIIAHTVHMLIFGDRANAAAIRQAWRDLQRAGICSSGEWATGQRRAGEPWA
jgi:lipopolysaccharide/colanic/teichoic acid biosynthesis glycosyltransferase